MTNLFAAIKYVHQPWYEVVPFAWVKEEAGKLFVRFPAYYKTDVKKYYQDRVRCRDPEEDWMREEIQLLKTCRKYNYFLTCSNNLFEAPSFLIQASNSVLYIINWSAASSE